MNQPTTSRVTNRLLVILGAVAVIAAVIGFLTVADDLRHTGELIGVCAILVIGLVLIVVGTRNSLSRRMAMPWLAVGIGVGAAVGAATDNMAMGVAIGAAIGAALSGVRGARKQC